MQNVISVAQATVTNSQLLASIIECCNVLAREQDTDNNFMLIDTATSLAYYIGEADNSEQLLDAAKLDILELDPDTALEVYNILFDGFGIESVRDHDLWDNYYLDTSVLYVNQGDSYTETLIFDVEERKLLYTTLADFIEAKQQEIESSYYLFCDSRHGVYSWQMSAQEVLTNKVINPAAKDDLQFCADNGPDHEDFFDVADDLTRYDWLWQDSDGQRWYLQQNEDIFAVKEGKNLPSSFN
jgi:hypothetical protein